MAKHTEGFCQICDEECYAFTSAYSNHVFIDGRKYKEICWICASVPKMWELLVNYDDGFAIYPEYLMTYSDFNPKRLHTVQEMEEDGFDTVSAKHSIKMIKRAIKGGKPLLPSDSQPVGSPIEEIKEIEEIEEIEEVKVGRKKKSRKRKNAYKKTKTKSPSKRPLKRDITIREI